MKDGNGLGSSAVGGPGALTGITDEGGRISRIGRIGGIASVRGTPRAGWIVRRSNGER